MKAATKMIAKTLPLELDVASLSVSVDLWIRILLRNALMAETYGTLLNMVVHFALLERIPIKPGALTDIAMPLMKQRRATIFRSAES
jgi:hypothetical protein